MRPPRRRAALPPAFARDRADPFHPGRIGGCGVAAEAHSQALQDEQKRENPNQTPQNCILTPDEDNFSNKSRITVA
ncbi:hypothetical protein MSC49_41620 (plasmid) [Methylosinus sp. C49]|nr:hypothetical protein MSC49_41620 [Methylosinus sp. C49]